MLRWRRMKIGKQKGFTLVEVCMAVLLIGVGVYFLARH